MNPAFVEGQQVRIEMPPRCNQLHPYLVWVGPAESRVQVDRVVNCAAHQCRTSECAGEGERLELQMEDDGSTDLSTSQQVKRALQFLQRDSERRVLVHCAEGCNRSVTLCLLYLAGLVGLAAAAELVARSHPYACIHPGYQKQLREMFPDERDVDLQFSKEG